MDKTLTTAVCPICDYDSVGVEFILQVDEPPVRITGRCSSGGTVGAGYSVYMKVSVIRP